MLCIISQCQVTEQHQAICNAPSQATHVAAGDMHVALISVAHNTRLPHTVLLHTSPSLLLHTYGCYSEPT